LIKHIRFDAQEILAGEDRLFLIGVLNVGVNTADKTIDSPFALILTVSEGKITRFQMLEDTIAISRATRS
jgi:ketosteroid isomerase-like protein